MLSQRIRACAATLLVAANGALATTPVPQVVYVSRNRTFFVVNLGKKSGFKKNQEICVAGDAGQVVFCAPIVFTNNSMAAVRVPRAQAETIAVGQAAGGRAQLLVAKAAADAAPSAGPSAEPGVASGSGLNATQDSLTTASGIGSGAPNDPLLADANGVDPLLGGADGTDPLQGVAGNDLLAGGSDKEDLKAILEAAGALNDAAAAAPPPVAAPTPPPIAEPRVAAPPLSSAPAGTGSASGSASNNTSDPTIDRNVTGIHPEISKPSRPLGQFFAKKSVLNFDFLALLIRQPAYSARRLGYTKRIAGVVPKTLWTDYNAMPTANHAFGFESAFQRDPVSIVAGLLLPPDRLSAVTGDFQQDSANYSTITTSTLAETHYWLDARYTYRLFGNAEVAGGVGLAIVRSTLMFNSTREGAGQRAILATASGQASAVGLHLPLTAEYKVGIGRAGLAIDYEVYLSEFGKSLNANVATLPDAVAPPGADAALKSALGYARQSHALAVGLILGVAF